ncbi:hypothetical protein P43SY_005209 [Pythium insidiosum]|uniref:Mre11 DNA-binding domain-containing protein n=1 Tax=Pythium insidiosum TaxID=114742 RepID=A0AAD5LMY4_PYTIN|nr:hypothetical protein P43SY_005209 [Pythium insidiosum]
MVSPPPPSASASASPAPAPRDTLRVLLATDNHLGYAEKDAVRGDDSFRTFEEILALAKHEKVDLLLLAGDLFHENKPSRRTLYQTMRLLRAFCMGDGAVPFQIVSDQSLNFPNFGQVNYEHPHFNIELPVFSIHGNHDDPSREGPGGAQALAALDLLSAANLVNYFGKSDKVDALEVFPVLLVKGATRVAIYGLGNVRDERLHRLFAQQKVVFRRPAEDPDAWFSLLVVHQNRDDRGRGAKNCLPESFIPDFIDFVVWGHEHECRVDVAESVRGEFFITQPGSSVATSLVPGEAVPKQVAVLEVRDQRFRLSARPLRTVRPFKMADVILSEIDGLDPDDPNVAARIHDVLERHVLKLLDEAEEEFRDRPPELKEVLIRLRVEHTGFPVVHSQRFGGRFVGRVANPNDILLFHRRKKDRQPTASKQQTTTTKAAFMKAAGLDGPIRPTRLDTVTVEDLVTSELLQSDKRLVFLPEAPLALALEEYVVKNIPSALDEFVKGVLEETQQELKAKRDARSTAEIVDAVEKRKDKTNAEHLVDQEERESSRRRGDGFLDTRPSQSQSQSQSSARREVGLDRDEEMDVSPPSTARARKPTVSRTLKRRQLDNVDEDGESDEDFGSLKRSTTQPRKRTTPTKKPASTAAKRRKKSVLYDEESDEDEVAETVVVPSKRSSTASSSRRPSRAASLKAEAQRRRSMLEDDSDGGENGSRRRQGGRVLDNDDDEDFDFQEEEEEEEEEEDVSHAPARTSSSSVGGRKTTATATATARSTASTPAPARKRLRGGDGKKKDDGEINLCSSSEEDTARRRPAPIPAATSSAAPPRASAPPKRPTPQTKITDMFRKQREVAGNDDVESDREFAELKTATTAAAQQLDEEATVSQAHSFGMSQSQSQSQSQTGTRRKLPLSLLAASQTSVAATPGARATPASTQRKGWGRTRR